MDIEHEHIGALAPLIDTDLETTIRIRELVARIEKQGVELKEIIFALAANPEGDRTTTILKQRLEPLQERLGFSISQLGRGFSTGTEVEYSDADTLANALLNRK
jgi:recombinational DNA repair protein RecR